MMTRTYGIALLAVLGVSGCATHWQHSLITDVEQANRQFKLDNAYCLRVAHGAVPMPSIPVTPTGAGNVSGQMRIYDTSTGQTTFGSYSGSVVSSPASSFASGFANGMAMGAAIAAQRMQDQIHDECMIRKGWKEAPLGASRAAPMLTVPSTAPVAIPAAQSPSSDRRLPADHSEMIYKDGKSAWQADIDEFVALYPGYRESRQLWDRLDSVVRRIATERPSATGSQILLAAHDRLSLKGEGVPEPDQDDPRWFITDAYRQAVAGSVVDQNALGYGFMYGKKPLPRDHQRARFWFQKSAKSGDVFGQIGYGTLIFEGEGQVPDRARGYWWVRKAALAGDKDAVEMLAVMKAKMSVAELQAVDAMQ